MRVKRAVMAALAVSCAVTGSCGSPNGYKEYLGIKESGVTGQELLDVLTDKKVLKTLEVQPVTGAELNFTIQF